MIELCYDFDNLPTPSLIFTPASIMWKFGLILDFKAIQFRNEATHLTCNDTRSTIKYQGHSST